MPARTLTAGARKGTEQVAHDHDHGFKEERLGPRLLGSLALNILILTVQLIGGTIAGSVALIADALHNLTDVASLALSYVAFRVSRQPADARYSFAYLRAEVLAAVLNAGSLVGVSLYVGFEAVQRLIEPEPVAGGLVMGFAAFGMVANAAAALLLRGHGSNLNIRSAVLHLVSDSVASLGVVAAGALMQWFGWYVVDPIVSLLLAAWMIKESLGLLRAATSILMQGVPEGIELDRVTAAIAEVEDVDAVHDLHVWAMNSAHIVLSAHVVFRPGVDESQRTERLREIKQLLHDRFEVEHATLEAESVGTCAGGVC